MISPFSRPAAAQLVPPLSVDWFPTVTMAVPWSSPCTSTMESFALSFSSVIQNRVTDRTMLLLVLWMYPPYVSCDIHVWGLLFVKSTTLWRSSSRFRLLWPGLSTCSSRSINPQYSEIDRLTAWGVRSRECDTSTEEIRPATDFLF